LIENVFTDPISGSKITFRSSGPPMATCPLCNETFGATNGFDTMQSKTDAGRVPGAGAVKRLGTICNRCFYAGARDYRAVERERAAAAKLAPAPAAERNPADVYSATRWPTYADAFARLEVVAAHLGLRPDVVSVDARGKAIHPWLTWEPVAAYVCCPDSPLVPGYPKNKTTNPYA
jgi:hypothetical protein